MKKNKKLLFKITNIFIIFILFVTANTYAHSGRTDSSGGHKDNKNASGLGSYHYHCGGYPAHLHTNGVCPYKSGSTSSSSNSKSSTKNSSSSSSSSKSSTTTKSSTTQDTTIKTVDVDSIDITDENIRLKVGDSIKLNTTILPENATNKNVTWSSSDESIVKVDEQGNITALKVGIATITATSNNSKSDSIKIETYTVPERIELNKSISELKNGETIRLGTKVTPEDAEYTLKWSSDNEDVIQIVNGEIVAKKPGNAIITVETDNGKKDSIELVITANEKETNEIEKNIEVNKNNQKILIGVITIASLGIIGIATIAIVLGLHLGKKQ